MEQQQNLSKRGLVQAFWAKVKSAASSIGCPLLCVAFQLFYVLQDKQTPVWAKTTIVGALGYLISQIDAIPDFTPFLGYNDDFVLLSAALATVANHVKPEHRKKAQQVVRSYLKTCSC